MNTYWLLRGGGQVEGPFLHSQLRLMWGRGRIAAADQICQAGTDEWQAPMVLLGEPVVAIAKPAEPVPEEPAPRVERTHKFPVWTGVIALTVALALVVYAGWWRHAPDLKEVMQKYVEIHFADRKPQLVTLGIPLEWPDGKLRLVPVRGGNQVGPKLVTYLVLQISADNKKVLNAWEREDWLDRFRDTAAAKDYPLTVQAVSRMWN